MRHLPDTSSGQTEPLYMGQYGDEREWICGWGAAFVNITVTFPVNKIMFRQQLYGIKASTAFNQIRKEGIGTLYKGLLPPLLQKTAAMSIMFGSFDTYSKVLRNILPISTHWVHISIMAGVLAGMTEATLLPFERIQTLLQDRHHSESFKNTWHAANDLKQYGVREYYRGLTAVLLRNGPSNAIFFTLRGPFKEALPEPSSQVGHVVNDFISGAVLGASISTVVYPLNVVKTRMQCSVGGEYTSVRTTLQVVLIERNYSWRKMFRGVHVNFTRSLISWGIVNSVYEFLKKRLNSI